MSRKPPGYWDDWKNVEEALRPVITRLGRFPTMPEFRELGLSGLLDALSRSHGGTPVVRDRLGLAPAKYPEGFYKEWMNIVHQMEEAKALLGHFPSTPEMRQLGFPTLADGIRRYHGGLKAVREKLGAEEKKAPNGSLKSWPYVKEQLEVAREELGHFPTQAELSELGMPSISVAVSSYHGGFATVREKMGEELERRPNGYWESWENVEKGLRALMDALGRFPKRDDFRARNMTGLQQSMQRNFGGVPACRRRLGIMTGRKSNGYYHDWKNVVAVLLPIIEELGRFPLGPELETRGHRDLLAAIERTHGGLRAVAEKMGHELAKKPDGHWRVWENVEQELRRLFQKLGRPPTKEDFKAEKLGSVSIAISKYHGGYDAVRKRLGWTSVTHDLLNRYADQVAVAYMTAPGNATSLDEFLTTLQRGCPYECDLRVRLGLPPESETTESA
ncbi:MAG: hypothetical protein AAB413_04900 [Patescibacteria group bacterium]